MEPKTCCVLACKDIPPDRMDYIKDCLEEELDHAIADGYNTFITGIDMGVDLIFSNLVLTRKIGRPYLELIAMLPSRRLLKSLHHLFNKRLKGYKSAYAPETTPPGKIARIRDVLTRSERLIAVYDYRREKDDIFFAMRYAGVLELEVRPVPFDPPPQAPLEIPRSSG